MSEGARSYVQRMADEQLFQKLEAGLFCYVLNSRQMGKSSLCVRTKAKLELAGIHTVFVDLTKIGGRNVTVDQWYAGIAFEVGRTLNLRNEIVTYWKENDRISAMQKLFECLRYLVLEKIEGSLVIFVDEIDCTRSLPFDTDEFFAGIRECYNRRVLDSTYDRLTFCLLGVAVPTDLIKNSKTTPFNVGERVYLRDFTLDEALSLAKGLPTEGENLVRRVHFWTNGHPFLTQSLCTAIANNPQIRSEKDVDDLVARELLDPKARETDINLADVGARVLTGNNEGEDPDKFRADVLSAYSKVLKGRETIADDESNRISAVLKLSGLMRSEDKALKVRNRIYEKAFDKTWIQENMPGQELRRQRRAFALGVVRTSLVAAVIIGVIAFMAFQNYGLRIAAEKTARAERYQSYVATMNFIPSIYEQGNVTKIHNLLADRANDAWKGFEWSYWDRISHPADAESVKTEPANFLSLSKDGQEIVMTEQGELWIFDSHTLALNRKVEAECTPSSQIVFLRDKTVFIQALDGIGGILVDYSTGKAKKLLPNYRYFAFGLGVSPDGRRMLAQRDGADGSYVYDLDTDKVSSIGTGAACFSPDGRLLALSGGSGGPANPKFFVKFLDSHTLKELRTVQTPHFFGSPRFSSDGLTYLGVDNLRLVQSMDVATGRTVESQQMDEEFSTMNSAGSKYYVVGTRSGRLITYDLKTLQKVWDVKLTEGRIPTIAISDNGKYAFALSRVRKGFLVDLDKKELLRTIPEANTTFFLRDNSAFVTAYSNLALYKVGVSDLVTTTAMPPRTELYKFRQVGNKEFVTLRDDQQVRKIYEIVGDKLELKATRPKLEWVTSATGNFWCIQERGKQFAIRDIYREKDLLTFGGGQFTKGVLESIGDDKVAISRDARTIEIWSLVTKRKLGEITWPAEIDIFKSDAAGRQLIVSDRPNAEVGIVDVETCKIRWRRSRDNGGHSQNVTSARFSRDGKLLVTASDDDSAALWDAQTGTRLQRFVGHAQSVMYADISPDNSRVASVSDDQTLRAWDAKTGLELSILGSPGPSPTLCVFTMDGKAILTGTEDFHLKRWPITQR